MSARDELVARLVAEQHNGGGFVSPPREWNATESTAVLFGHTNEAQQPHHEPPTFDDDLTVARRRKVLTDVYSVIEKDDLNAAERGAR